ncbi:universal stress protein [Paucilactobacillus kaifaensis]|uniref:universal stress protein n=1 Tax=Paucilactobacillus kaifaensis TaxID=2559921 RepID=UPI0010F63158|nr:universal stress protein [Paucilactobacillus kaifaensis]
MDNEKLNQPLIFRRVLLTVDEDDPNSSIHAFRYAATLAHDYQVKLCIVSVLESDDLNIFDVMTPGTIDQRADDIRKTVEHYIKLAQGLGVNDVQGLTISAGDVDDVILDRVIPEFKPDLIVCGSDTDDPSHRVPGAVGLRIARRANVSVIVVR